MAAARPGRPAGKRLGRPPGDNGTAEKILDAAEAEFAQRGYDGTSLREITETLDVNQALIRYYFGSKEGLYRAVFLRRAHQIVRERIRRLDELEARPGRPPTVLELLEAFIAPLLDVKREGAGGVAYLRLQARLQNETQPLARELRGQVYEESSQRYIAAFKRALPQVDPSAIYWRMVFMVGAYFYTISDTNRLDVLSAGKYSTKDVDESLRQLLSFLKGGLEAPLLPPA